MDLAIIDGEVPSVFPPVPMIGHSSTVVPKNDGMVGNGYVCTENVSNSGTNGNLGICLASRSSPNFIVMRPDFLIRSTAEDQVMYRVALRRRKAGFSSMHIATFFDMISSCASDSAFCLCNDAMRLMFEENAGGSSEISEAFSMEILARRLGAFDSISEMEIKYWSPCWKKIDYICSISQDQRVGVSVTRLMGFPDFNHVTKVDCVRLLRKKLYGLIVAKAGINQEHHYSFSLLHVFCASVEVASLLASVICQANALFSKRATEGEACFVSREDAEELEDLAFLYDDDVGGSNFSDDLIIHITVANETPCIFNNDANDVAFKLKT